MSVPTDCMILWADGEQEHRRIDGWPEEPSYEIIRDFVEPVVAPDGGHLEHVAIMFPGVEQKDMFVNDIGHMLGLPFNCIATDMHRAGRGPGAPAIVGNAIVFGRKIWK